MAIHQQSKILLLITGIDLKLGLADPSLQDRVLWFDEDVKGGKVKVKRRMKRENTETIARGLSAEFAQLVAKVFFA